MRNKRRCSVVGCHTVRIRLGRSGMRAVACATCSAPDRVPMCPACQCSARRRHLPSLTLTALVFAVSFSIYLDHDYTKTYHPLYTFPLSWPRACARAPLAYLPSLHLSVSSRLSAPSQCVLATPLRSVVWRHMICRCGVVAGSAADSFWVPSLHAASFPGGFLPGRWRFRSLFMTLVGTASPQYNRS
jgi:hypothetical protein